MAKSQSLLVRLLNTPDFPTIVPRLQPDVLHRVIQTCGVMRSWFVASDWVIIAWY